MFINRRTVNVKPGCVEGVIGLLKGEEANIRPLVESVQPIVMTASFGTSDTVVWEGRFESLAEYDKFWSDWVELPTTQRFFETLNPLIERGGQNELWEVH